MSSDASDPPDKPSRPAMVPPALAPAPEPAHVNVNVPAPVMPDGPRRRPSGLLRVAVYHTERARAEIASRPSSAPPLGPSESITPVPDPVRMAAAMIVNTVRRDLAGRSDDECAEYVQSILRDLVGTGTGS